MALDKFDIKKLLLLSISLLFFQNCGDFQSITTTIDSNNTVESAGFNFGPQKKAKLGLIFGPNTTQEAVDITSDIGDWYYNYSPHPNRDEPTAFYETVTMANRFNKEFVPMVYLKTFKLDETNHRCSLLEVFSKNNEPVCTVKQISRSLRRMKRQFKASNQPKHIMVFNEPWHEGDQIAGSLHRGYRMTPWQAAKAYALIEKAATHNDLAIVSPTIADGHSKMLWFAAFLKRCYDLRNNSNFPCDIEKIRTFSYHSYKCGITHFQKKLDERKMQERLISMMKNSQGHFYGRYDWSSYIGSRKVWLTETSCNWDPDFARDQRNGELTRTQKKSCRRATGQKEGFGSLKVLSRLPDSRLERYAWWTTYANPLDFESEVKANRVEAARLVNDDFKLTAMGRAIKALSRGKPLARVKCSE